jgi:hypothetical protein
MAHKEGHIFVQTTKMTFVESNDPRYKIFVEHSEQEPKLNIELADNEAGTTYELHEADQILLIDRVGVIRRIIHPTAIADHTGLPEDEQRTTPHPLPGFRAISTPRSIVADTVKLNVPHREEVAEEAVPSQFHQATAHEISVIAGLSPRRRARPSTPKLIRAIAA